MSLKGGRHNIALVENMMLDNPSQASLRPGLWLCSFTHSANVQEVRQVKKTEGRRISLQTVVRAQEFPLFILSQWFSKRIPHRE